jgi:hypothetical protein
MLQFSDVTVELETPKPHTFQDVTVEFEHVKPLVFSDVSVEFENKGGFAQIIMLIN